MLYLDFLATGETPICMADAAKLLPAKPNGKRLSQRAIERYIREGYGPSGSKVLLEGAKVAGSMATSREALQRFIQKCSVADELRHRGAAATEAVIKTATQKVQNPRRNRARREGVTANA